MALALFDRVQETTTTTGTGAVTLDGAVPGYQSFAVVGNTNTCYYTIVDGVAWEVGVGTYSTSGPTLARTTVLSNSNGNTSPITLAVGTKTVFLTYPAGKSVNLNESGNVSPLGTVVSGIWNGTTIGVAYGGTGVTASSGANSVVLRDSNQNVAVNRVNQANTNTTAAGGTTALTAASSYIHTLVGTGGQTYSLPDATTLTTGVAFVFNNLATSTLTVANYAGTTIGTIPSGGAGAVFLTLNSTVGGTWDLHAYLPEGVTFGTNAFNLGTSVITGGTWQGGTIATGYGGTGLTSYTSGGAVYANSSSTLTSGTLPVTAGGTGNTTGNSATTSQTNFSNLTIGGSQVLYAGNYNSYAPTLTGGGASGTWGINVTGNSATVSSITGNTNLLVNSLAAPAVIDGLTTSNFRSTFFNTTSNGYQISAARWNTTPSVFSSLASYGTAIAWSGSDTQGFLAVNYYTQGAMIGGGYGNNLVWTATLLTSANYNSYAPTLTGGGASGTWGINITGSAGSAGSVDYNNLTNKTGGTGTYTTSGDYRAPIFYDSDNTGYFVNPASGSQFSNVNLNAGLGAAADGAGNDPYGFISVTRGTGANYSYYGLTRSGNYVVGMGIDTSNYFWIGGVSSGYNGVRTSNSFFMNVSGDTWSVNSSRAPIFYDSDNTAYYVNPTAATSAVFLGSVDARTYNYAGLLVNASGTGSTGAAFGIQQVTAEGWTGVFVDYEPNTGWGLYHDNPNNYFCITAETSGGNIRSFTVPSRSSGNRTAYEKIRFDQNNGDIITGAISYAYASMRSPIFYDYNDTAYYLNPNDTGTSLRLAGYGYFGLGIDGDGVVINHDQIWTPAGTFHIQYSGGGNINMCQGGGFAYTPTTSMRSPIFYDYDNTAYYIDPSSTGTSMNAAGNITIGNGGANTGLFINYGGGSGDYAVVGRCYQAGSNNQTIHVFSTTWQGGTLQSTSAGSINLSGANGVTIGPWNNNDMWIDTSGNSQSRGSSRAPIFYDSNNTAYYVDPASGTNLAGTITQTGPGRTNIVGPSNYDTRLGSSDLWFWFKSIEGNGSSGYPGAIQFGRNDNAFSWPIVLNPRGGNVGINSYSADYTLHVAGTSYASSDMRSPIFYDSNNTGFYTDPASTSYINGLSVGAQTWRGDITWNGSVNIFVNGESSFDVSGGTWQVWDTGNGAPMLTCPYQGQVTIGNAGSRGLYVYGSITASGNVTAYSDERVKTNWRGYGVDFVQRLAEVKHGTYDRTDQELTQDGVSAQSLQKLLPHSVMGDESLSVAYGNAALVSSIELAKYVTALEQRISQLEARL